MAADCSCCCLVLAVVSWWMWQG